MWIDSKPKYIDVEIVENTIPLLISKADMKKMGMTVDFSRDLAFIGEKQLSLGCTSMGHYYISVTKEKVNIGSCNVVLHTLNVKGMNKREKLQKAIKLHRQLSHASKDKLIKVIKNSKFKDDEFMKCIDECIDKCELCQKYRKAPLRPVVRLLF